MFIKGIQGCKTRSVWVCPNDEAQDLKARILQDLEEQTIGLDNDILISSFKHLLKEKKVNLAFQNKMLEEDGRTLNDYSTQKDSTILMTSGLPGGGKRAKQDKSETILSKDEKLKANSFEKDKNMYILNTMTANPIVPDIINNIAKIGKAVSQKVGMKEMFKLLSCEILDDLLTSLRTHRDSIRTQGLVNAIFAEDLQNTAASKQILDTSENTLFSFVEVIFTKEYCDKKCDWKRYEDDVREAIKHAVRSEGASQAAAPA